MNEIKASQSIAYFSMEIGLESNLPTYSGGLGMLTSGMKAALKGVPSLSVLDGWWVEGCIEGVTGWAIGKPWRLNDEEGHDRSHDSASLYEKLENAVIPLFYNNRDQFADVMRHCIALNGSFFNTQRMLQQYVQKAYFL
jgi:starch phosphorylase